MRTLLRAFLLSGFVAQAVRATTAAKAAKRECLITFFILLFLSLREWSSPARCVYVCGCFCFRRRAPVAKFLNLSPVVTRFSFTLLTTESAEQTLQKMP